MFPTPLPLRAAVLLLAIATAAAPSAASAVEANGTQEADQPVRDTSDHSPPRPPAMADASAADAAPRPQAGLPEAPPYGTGFEARQRARMRAGFTAPGHPGSAPGGGRGRGRGR